MTEVEKGIYKILQLLNVNYKNINNSIINNNILLNSNNTNNTNQNNINNNAVNEYNININVNNIVELPVLQSVIIYYLLKKENYNGALQFVKTKRIEESYFETIQV